MLHHERLAADLLERCDASELEDPVVGRIVARIADAARAGAVPSAAALLEELREDVEATALLGEIAVTEAFLVEPERIAHDCVQGFAKRTLNAQAADLDREMRKAKAQGEESRSIELMQQRLLILQRIQALRTESVAGER
jgi:hypothetical protein